MPCTKYLAKFRKYKLNERMCRKVVTQMVNEYGMEGHKYGTEGHKHRMEGKNTDWRDKKTECKNMNTFSSGCATHQPLQGQSRFLSIPPLSIPLLSIPILQHPGIQAFRYICIYIYIYIYIFIH